MILFNRVLMDRDSSILRNIQGFYEGRASCKSFRSTSCLRFELFHFKVLLMSPHVFDDTYDPALHILDYMNRYAPNYVPFQYLPPDTRDQVCVLIDRNEPITRILPESSIAYNQVATKSKEEVVELLNHNIIGTEHVFERVYRRIMSIIQIWEQVGTITSQECARAWNNMIESYIRTEIPFKVTFRVWRCRERIFKLELSCLICIPVVGLNSISSSTFTGALIESVFTYWWSRLYFNNGVCCICNQVIHLANDRLDVHGETVNPHDYVIWEEPLVESSESMFHCKSCYNGERRI